LFPIALFPLAWRPQDSLLPAFSQGGGWIWILALAVLAAACALVYALRLRSRANRRSQDLALLNEVAQIISEPGPLEPMLSRALQKTAGLIPAAGGVICVKCEGSSRISVAHLMPVEEAEELLRAMGKAEPRCAGEAIQVVHIGKSAPSSLQERGVTATISVPLIHQDELLGSMCIALRHDRPLPASRLQMLAGAGRLLALGIARTRLQEEAERNLSCLTALRDLDMAASSTLELRPSLRLLLENIQQAETVVGAAVTLVDSATRLQTLADQVGLDGLLERAGGWASLDYLAEQVLEAQNVVLLSRLSQRQDASTLRPLTEMGINAYWGFPLVAGGQVTGILSVFSNSTNGSDPAVRTYLTALSGQAASAIQNAQLYGKATEQLRQLQATRELLVQNEKLTLIGELVSGVAHELNNPLTTILGYSQMLEEDAQAVSLKNDLRQITEAALRSRTIVQGLLSVVRKHAPRHEWVDVNKPLREVLQLKAYQLHVDNIAVETELTETLPRALADPHQLHQVFLNLVNNAHQAMARTYGRGQLTVRSYLKDAQTIRVEVGDDGPGIPPGLQQRIFEPFFTTKREGTGLGLSIAHGIVRQHGGDISFDSLPGQGCRFFVDLPIVAAAEATVLPRQEAELQTLPSCRILVVEDETAVADFISRVLQRAGHDVRTAANGQEALTALADGMPDVIISDVKMPAMRGDQFFTELQVLYPELAPRVIFITGDIADQRTLAFLEQNRQPRLVKPFGADELRQKVASVLH